MISKVNVASIRELLEAGVHFGHKQSRRHPKMTPYISTFVKNNYPSHRSVDIIDLPQTVDLLKKACDALCDCARKGGRILFVGTKFQAKEAIQQAAERCGQYYVNHRWLGGMLTNWKTVSSSIKRLQDIEAVIESPEFSYSKKEQLNHRRIQEKYQMSLGGLRTMGGVPDMLFVIDARKDAIAVREAKCLGIPVVGIVDTNINPETIDYPIVGNDDGLRAIQLYCRFASDAILAGLAQELEMMENAPKSPKASRKKTD
jgi:small subunit ribosomal protein S2